MATKAQRKAAKAEAEKAASTGTSGSLSIITKPEPVGITLTRSLLAPLAIGGVREIIRPEGMTKERVAKKDCKVNGVDYKAGATIAPFHRPAKVMGESFAFVPQTFAELQAHCKANEIKGNDKRLLMQAWFHGEAVEKGNLAATASLTALHNRGGVTSEAIRRGNRVVHVTILPDGADRETAAEKNLRREKMECLAALAAEKEERAAERAQMAAMQAEMAALKGLLTAGK